MAVTFVAVILFGKAMAMDAASAGKQASERVTPASASSVPTQAVATADPGVLPSDKVASAQSYYHQVDAIRTDTELVTAQIDNLKAHHELAEARGGVFKSDTPAAPSGMPMMQMPGMLPPADTATDTESRSPTVVQTSMIDGRWAASIRLPSGGYINNARAGQVVSGVGKILSISLNDVTVSNGKKTYSLPFASDESASGTAVMPGRNGGSIAPPIGIR
ncbi:MAG: type IV pilus biogenesis protein PilP [Rhodanobacter sp.]